MPFKSDHDIIPDNFRTSKNRLDSLDRKFEGTKVLKDYGEIFQEYEEAGIIETVPEDELTAAVGKVHYLPHRPVIQEERETTKIRPVFDDFCAVNGPSLNRCLYSGPNLLSKIFDVLIRFRLNKIALLADIKKAFLNVEVSKDHRDFFEVFMG